jgi:hypothetical protein
MLVNAILVNRNLLSSLKDTIDFLRKEPRINKILIVDHASTYPELLEWYKTTKEDVDYLNYNGSAQNAWNPKYSDIRKEYFIVADPDCSYEGVPDDWLDKMLEVLNQSHFFKVGFSLEIDDLPDTELGTSAKKHECKYWTKKLKYGWDAFIDTTFALYRPNSAFSYNAIRLDKPYCIKHVPWYLTDENITKEWMYYLKNCSHVSTWGSKLKKAP